MPARQPPASGQPESGSRRTKEGYQQVAVVDDADDAEDADDADDDANSYDSGKTGRRNGKEMAADDDSDETRRFLPLDAAQLSSPQHHRHRPGQDASAWLSRRTFRTVVVAFVTCLVVCVAFKFIADNSGLSMVLPDTNREGTGTGTGAGAKEGQAGEAGGCRPTTVTVPQYFQTSPQLWAGPSATGRPAFLAQTVTIDPSATYVANQPLQTNIVVDGMPADDRSIFHHMGYLSPYNPSPGFGVQEYAMPPGAEIVQLQMLSRHGSRYPTTGSNVAALGEKLAKIKGKYEATGALSFLNDWEYKLGHEILVPKGRQELFDSGVLHSYMYGSLYNPNSKIIVRTTTQDRMLKSAENFLAGFFGLEWTNNATIEVIIEKSRFNNSLAGYLNCPNSNNDTGGSEASNIWIENYLRNATARFRSMLGDNVDWTIGDTYAAQNMCPYETVVYGFSRFCDLFTYEEWLGFGYSIDLAFAGNFGFQSSTGRAVGIGYQQEVLARLKNHTLGYSGSQINTTLDSSPETFPLNQSIYLDFSHDTNIIAILTAFGFQQFAPLLQPSAYPGDHNFTVSHIVPFGARLDIEVIRAPHPVAADRSGYEQQQQQPPSSDGAAETQETKYVHFLLNQRTLPLGASFPECDAARVDGWCEFETFLRVQAEMEKRAKYDEACFGKYTARPYGMIMDGAPM